MTDNGSSTQDPGWTTGWQRLSQTFLRPGPRPIGSPTNLPDVARMTDDEKRAYISRVDPTERKVGLIAAAVAFVLAIYANVPHMVSKAAVVTTVKPTDKTCPSGYTYALTASKGVCKTVYPPSHYVLPLIVSLVLAIAVYVTVRIRRRAPLAFVIVMNGLAYGDLLVLVPFAVGGGWIMLRAWRTQRYGSPTARAAVEGWTPPPPRGTTRRAKSAGPGGGRSTTRRDKSAPATGARKAPTANKRYTPKTPPNPKKKVTPPS